MQDFVLVTPQRARCLLRTNFLYALCDLSGKPCDITTIEKSTLSGNFKGWKADGAQFIIKGLKTPTGEKINTSLMRTSDILSIEFKQDIILPVRCKVVPGVHPAPPPVNDTDCRGVRSR